jgi:predicted ABC-type ATPase
MNLSNPSPPRKVKRYEKTRVENYKKFIEGQDENWIYDETYRFLEDLSRGEMCEIMDYLVKSITTKEGE